MSDIYNAGAFEKRRLTRLLIEALEVAFHLCNSYTEEYSLTKIFDIVNSIMPTAYILNTGYWVFYSTHGGQGVCICVRFGLYCPHQRNNNHWINMEGMSLTDVTPFSSIQKGKFWPIDLNIHVTPMINDALRSYDALIKMTVQSFQPQDVAVAATSPTGFIICTELRYLMSPEYYPHESKIVQFTPHPLTHRIYGKYFVALHTYFDTFGSQSQFFYKNTVVTSMFPKLTIIPYGGTFSPNSYSHNLRGSYNFSVRNEVNIAIYNENNYGSIGSEIANVAQSGYENANDYCPNPKTPEGFPQEYVVQHNSRPRSTYPQEFSFGEIQHKQRKRRGKSNRSQTDARMVTEKIDESSTENLPTPSTSSESQPNEVRPPPGFLPSLFQHNGFELKKDQGVKRKENKAAKAKNIACDSFTLPDIVIENSQDANEYLEDISDIIKNDMAQSFEKTIKLEQVEDAEDRLFDMTKSPTSIGLLISSDEEN